jgi:hypothetical protein
MIKWLKREFFGWFAGFKDYISGLDSCELCGNEWTDSTCSGCNKRICCMCESGYYEDESLCKRCRHDITPEEEEEDRRDAANSLAEECTCPAEWNGVSSCELSRDEHEFVRKYAVKEVAE